ncbi:hypothetical protein VTK73DRAFT_474 [Phialemonium thermophilum]|uniref:Uncharacterized protein n=1 Tax=Phialemonium thermophilum TaxID=223376 RepID=A0ABR3XF48_9PEZI
MPFFSRHHDQVEQPAPEPVRNEEERPKHHGLFGSRRRSTSPASSAATSVTNNSRRSVPTKTNGVSNGTTNGTSNGAGGGILRGSSNDIGTHGQRSLLRRSIGGGDAPIDPSILQARERVTAAEAAEREADRALAAARQSVQEAREHVRRLELEAEEEARRAKIKQFHAREVSKRGKQLGRFDL